MHSKSTPTRLADMLPWILKGLCLLLILSAPLLHAQLQWDRQQLDFKPTLQDTNVVARFAFKNDGTNSIAIVGIKTSCGCTTAVSDKRFYLPGEKGEITANFIFGDRIGLQQKTILVQTDAPKSSFSVLRLRVLIPEILKITPGFVRWSVGEDKTPKTMTIQVSPDATINNLKASSRDSSFLVELRPVHPGREYTLSVIPTNTSRPLACPLQIDTESTGGRSRKFLTTALVQ